MVAENWLKFPVVAKVPVVGNVTFVAPVLVNVTALAPEVEKFAAISILPANFRLRAALTRSNVNVRPAVNAVELAAEIVTSNAALVSLTLKLVKLSAVPALISGAVNVLLAKVSVPVKVAKVPVVGKVNVVVLVVVNVVEKAPLVANVLPSAKVKVALEAGAVIATLLTLVAVATPNTGVTNVGVLANTKAPVPVSSVMALAKLALLGVPKNVATPVPNPLIPVLTGSPVALVNVTEVGVPNTGVTNGGLVANTKAPLPVSSLITPFNSKLVVEAKSLNLLVVSAAVPVAAGNVIVFVPAVAVATTVIVPLVDP